MKSSQLLLLGEIPFLGRKLGQHKVGKGNMTMQKEKKGTPISNHALHNSAQKTARGLVKRKHKESSIQ
jgi:hypothetical protein